MRDEIGARGAGGRDPLGGEAVLLRTRGPWELRVGDVAHERMAEGKLLLARDRRASLPAEELLPDEALHELVRRVRAERLDAATPEQLPQHRRVLQQLLLGRIEQVEPCGDDALDRVGELRARRRAAQHPRVFLRVQRVPAGLLQQASLHAGIERRASEQLGEQLRRRLVRERRERDGQRVEPAPTPRRAPLEQLGPGRAEHEQWDVARPVDEMLDEVEGAVVGPVQILEHQDERNAVGDRLDQALPRRERLLAPACRFTSEPHQRAYPAREPAAVARVLEQRLERRRHLRLDLRRLVRLEHAEVCADRLADGAERTAPVGKRTSLPPVDEPRPRVNVTDELPDEPALPDPGHADDRHELCRALAGGPFERVAQQPQLDVAPDQRGAPVLSDVDAEPCARAKRLPDAHRLGLPLRLDGRGVGVLDDAIGRAVRALADKHAVDGGRRLHARSRVHDVARNESLTVGRARVERHERLAGVHGDPPVEPILDERIAHGERRAHRTFGVVLVRGRGAEHGHHRIADELLDRAAVPLELVAHAHVIRLKACSDVLRVGRLRTGRVPDEVDEDDADDLPLLARRRPGRELGSAAGAEAGVGAALAAASGAERHGSRVTRSLLSASGRARTRAPRAPCRARRSAGRRA